MVESPSSSVGANNDFAEDNGSKHISRPRDPMSMSMPQHCMEQKMESLQSQGSLKNDDSRAEEKEEEIINPTSPAVAAATVAAAMATVAPANISTTPDNIAEAESNASDGSTAENNGTASSTLSIAGREHPKAVATTAAVDGTAMSVSSNNSRKRARPTSPADAEQQQRQSSFMDSDEDEADLQQQQEQQPASTSSKSQKQKPSSSTAPPSIRINWSKSPHRERLARILNDWFSSTGLALDATSGKPIMDYKRYADKVGIPRTTLFKYIHKDPSKRRTVVDQTSGEEGKGRGKKRLIDDKGVRWMVEELKRKAEVANDGFSRQEAISTIMEHFGLSRTAASRQLSRHILPVMMNDGMTLLGEEVAGADHGEHHLLYNENEVAMMRQHKQQQRQSPQQKSRSIVISDATSSIGRALLKFFCINGHDVAGCGRNQDDIQSLQLEFPESKLSVVDVRDDNAVARWAVGLRNDGMDVDVVVANAEICPQGKSHGRAWEVPLKDFDETIDMNVKGVANMVRHFIPQMIQNATSASDSLTGTFVAMSSGLGRSPHPHCAAYCASKFAIEGMMKSVAMSLPDSMCAVPLAPGFVAPSQKNVTSAGEGTVQHHHLSNINNRGCPTDEDKSHINRWVNVAGPMILRLNRKDNGRSMSVKGFHTLRDRQSWIIQDGTGVPMNNNM